MDQGTDGAGKHQSNQSMCVDQVLLAGTLQLPEGSLCRSCNGLEFVKTLTHSRYKEASQQRAIGTLAYEANILVAKFLVSLQEVWFEYANGD